MVFKAIQHSSQVQASAAIHESGLFVELVPYSKIGWHVIDCYKHWLKDKKEWKDTTMTWEISAAKDGTEIIFTHIGLVPGIKCYNGCEKAWYFYIKESLFKLLTEGKGTPQLKIRQHLAT